MKKRSSSEASWALITEGVTASRLEAHRVRHYVNRGLKLADESPEREHIYQVAGDILTNLPERLTRLEILLDRTALALTKMGEDFLGARLPFSEKQLVEDSIEPAGGFRKGHVEEVASRWLRRQADLIETVEEVFVVRVDGKEVKDHIEDFVGGVIRDGQAIHKIVAEAIKTVEGYYPPDVIDYRKLLAAVVKIVAFRWGHDKMTPLLARIITHGDFVY